MGRYSSLKYRGWKEDAKHEAEKGNIEAENEYKKVKSIVKNYPKNNKDFGIFLFKIGRIEEAKEEIVIAITLFKARKNDEEVEGLEKLLDIIRQR